MVDSKIPSSMQLIYTLLHNPSQIDKEPKVCNAIFIGKYSRCYDKWQKSEVFFKILATTKIFIQLSILFYTMISIMGAQNVINCYLRHIVSQLGLQSFIHILKEVFGIVGPERSPYKTETWNSILHKNFFFTRE